MIYTIKEYALIEPQQSNAAEASKAESAPSPVVSAPAKKAARAHVTPKASPAVQPAAKPVARKTPTTTATPAKVAQKVKPAATATPKAKVAPKAEKVKAKLMRDSFTMPREDWDLIQQLKERTLAFKRPTKKSELLRAGLQVLVGLSDAKLQAALEKLTPLKAGRPKGLGK